MFKQSARIEKLENGLAVLILDDGQKINWPIKNLPDDVEQGSQISLIISSNKDQNEERENIAKKIINEIFK